MLLHLLALAASSAWAVDGLRLSGNVKDIYTESRTVIGDIPYIANLTRLSLVGDAHHGIFAAYLDFREEVREGNYFHTLDYKTFGLGQQLFYLRMENRVDHGDSWTWNQGVYRGWAGLEGDNAALRVGRQRIAWGTGKLWNPTDVLNPYQPISVERDDRRGVDVAYMRLSLGELSQFEAAYAPMASERETQFLERIRTHVGRADLSVMGGKVAGDDNAWMVGGDFAADLGEGSLHGEASHTDPYVADPYDRWLVGYEYRVPPGQKLSWLDDLWLLGEYYHNGAGARDPRLYDFFSVLTGKTVSVGREYVGVGLSKEITPLWTAEFYGIRNISDRSTFAGPDVKWNAATNLDIIAGVQYLTGTSLSEYGRLHPIYYLQAQAFFGS